MSIEDLTGTIVRKICTACSREFAGSGGICPHDGNMLIALPQDPYVGRRISDKYQVLSVLGTGGMGVVYLARHETMQCNVAIKMLRAQFVGDTASVKRFTQEAIATRRLNHANVITTYDHGFTEQGQPYIVMDCLKGKSLADEIKRLKQISVERVIHIFSQACDALDHAHKQGIIHRDLKPGNIMLITFEDDPDFVKVVDFGVAKVLPINSLSADVQTLTQAGEVCGSPVYMSPEQCQGHDLDRRADIYSMGVVIYESLVGKVPLMGRNMVETMSKHINETPPAFKDIRPDLYIPEKVEQAVMRALCKNPNGRQPSMAMLKQDLIFSVPNPRANPNLRSIAISTSSINADVPEKKSSWLLPAIVGGVTAALVVAGAGIFYFSQKQAAPPHQPATAVVAPAGTSTTVPAATTGPATTPGSTPGQAAVNGQAPVSGQSAAVPATGSSKVQTGSGTATPAGTPALAEKPPLQQADTHEAVKKPVRKAATVKKPVKVETPPKPHHVQTTAPARPKGGGSGDRWAELGDMRSYVHRK